jgi:hypothetical protein
LKTTDRRISAAAVFDAGEAKKCAVERRARREGRGEWRGLRIDSLCG